MDIKIVPLTELDHGSRDSFYQKAFHDKSNLLSKHWRWWYGVDHFKTIPLAAVNNDQMIGQAGTLSSSIHASGENFKSTWFIDFHIIQQYQGVGIGKKLTSEWIQMNNGNYLTYCNNSSYRIFKNFNWKRNHYSFRYATPLNLGKILSLDGPFKKRLLKNGMNIFSNLLTTNAPTLKPYLAINNYSSFLNLFMNNELLCKDKLECRIVRDEAWVEWRIKDAPNKIEFIFFEYGTAFSIARIHNFEGLKRLNILYVSGNFGCNEIALCAGMVKWAKEEFFDLVWMVTDSEAIKKSLKMFFLLPAHKKLLFAYSASSHALNTSLESNPISLCGLDGDLDIYQAQDLHI